MTWKYMSSGDKVLYIQ